MPVIVLPTTLAGADISDSGSIKVLSANNSVTDQPIRISGSNMPTTMIYDPELFETTPIEPLSASAMNGFNKAVETIYSDSTNPITDATAIHSLRHFQKSLPHLSNNPSAALDHAVIGIILAQFCRRISVIHAFGHGLSRRYPVHQGNTHAAVAPHVLEYLFQKIDARRRLLAQGLGVNTSSATDTEVAARVVTAITDIRDALGLPAQLRELESVDPDEFPVVAQFIVNDYLMENAPSELAPTPKEIEDVLYQAW